jgi:predicted Na+-dependent transporter
MTDIPGAKPTPEPSGISPWRRVLLAVGNLGFFVVAAVLFSWLVRSFAGEGVSWWMKGLFILIFVIALVAVDLVLQVVLLRPVRRSRAEPGATDDQPRE